MGKNRKQASLTNVVQYDSNFNLSIGTSTSSSFNSSGSIIAASGFTGSLSGSVFGLGNTVSFSSSVSSDLINLEIKSASVDISITNINSVTASNIARLSNLESKSSSVDISVSSLNTFSASNDNTSLNSKTGSYATTGSNSFYGTQVFSGSVYIANDLIVQGSSSIQYISASSVSIGTNIVQLNTANPSVRYAGLTMIDSGSVGGSGSFLYDSLQDEFIFVHRGNGTNITSSHFVLGPETYDSLGNETYLTCNIITKGTGKEHLVDSCIFDNGTTTCIKNNLIGTGTISGTTIYGSTIVCSPVGKFTSCIDAGVGYFSGNVCVGGSLVVQQASTFVNTVGLFGGSAQLYIGATSNASDFAVLGWCSTNKSLNIQNQSTANNPQLIIACDGKVGVAVRDPIVQLHVRTNVASESRPTNLATSATNSAVYFTTIAGSNAGIAFGQLGANSNYIQATYENGSACTPLILNPYSGNVGIGTGNTAPGGALDVVTCSNSTQNFYLRNTNNLDASSRAYFNVVAGNTSLSLLALAGGGSCGGTYIAGTTGADMYIQQSQGGTVNMIIKCNGNIGIGTSSPSQNLTVLKNQNADTAAGIYNQTDGTASSTTLRLDNGSYNGQLNLYANSYITSGTAVANTLRLYTDGPGGMSFSATNQHMRFYTSPNECLRMTILYGGSVGIGNANPRTQLDVGDIVNGVGGTTFCAFLVAQGTWATFACVTNGDTNVVTDITYVNNNDYNRSGVFVARWAYNAACAALHIVSCLWNDSQNINQFGLRNNGGALQICLGGGANGYRVQARTQGARATG